MREDLRIYVEDVTENINNLSGTDLDNYLFDLFKTVGTENTFELDDENVLDIRSSREKIDFLEEIFNNIERQDDKDKFLLELLTYDKYLDSSVISYFRDKVQVPEGLDDTEESNEEPEEEQELDTPTPSFDSGDTETTETNTEEEPEEELEESKKSEPELQEKEITKYEAKTAEMEQELAKLEQDLAELKANNVNSNISDNKKINLEVIDFSEILNDLENFTKVSVLNKEIEDLEKYLEEAKHNSQALENAMNNIQDVNTKDAFKHDLNVRKRDIEVKEKELSALKYKREIASKSAIHLNASSINKVIAEQISYTQETINAITDYINSVKNDKNNGIVENIPLEFYSLLEKANQVKNSLYEADMVFNNQTGEINVNKEEYQVAFGKLKNAIKDNKEIRESLNGISKQNENDIDNKDLKELIEKTKQEIEKRKENAKKYYDALNDIKNVENEIKSGKKPEDLQDNIENINNKINSISDNNLQNELRDELDKALNPEKIKGDPTPIPPGPVKKDPNKWKKWVSGLAGFALGAGIIGLTPLGLPGALVIAAGTQLIKKGVNKAHEKIKNENEVTNIEKTGKLAQFKEKIKGWLKDENIVKNINWFLNGTAIGAISMGALEMALGSGSQPIPPHREEEIIAQTDPYSNVRIGDNASGLDLSKGYDQANWASQNINAESLNQAIMQDGNSIIDSVRVTKDGVTHIVDSAGKSLTEVAQQLGVNPEELVMNITNGQGAPRTWVDAAEAVGRTL